MPPANILVVMTDDHGQWLSGAYGNDEIATPTIDYLASNGVRMENAFCPSPVCSPARASFFTGQYPSQHGIHDWLHPDYDRSCESDDTDWLGDAITLPEILGGGGYKTGLAGKWHCGQGYEQEVFEFSRTSHSEGWEVPDFSLAHDRCATDHAIQFLRNEASNEPFFLFLGLTATHGPWENEPERLVEKYRGTPFDDIPSDTTYPFARRVTERYYVLENEHESLAQMYAAAHGIDELFGQIIDELHAQDVFDDTLVIYTADHGHNCGHHGLWGKGNCTGPQNMLEESIRIPLVIGGHGSIISGQNRNEFVDHCDTFQTILDVAEIDPLPNYDYPGESFMTQLTQRDAPFEWDQTQICEYGNVRMARDERYKLVRRHPDGPDLLFDLDEDPRETKNVIEQSAVSGVYERLGHAMNEFFDVYSDPGNDGRCPSELPQPNGYPAWKRHIPDCTGE